MKTFTRIFSIALTLCTLLSSMLVFSLTSSAEIGKDESGYIETPVWNTDYVNGATVSVKPYGTIVNGAPHMSGDALLITGSSEDRNPFVLEEGTFVFTLNTDASVQFNHYVSRSNDPVLADNFAVHYQFYFSASEAFPQTTMRVVSGNKMNLVKILSSGHVQPYNTEYGTENWAQASEGWNTLSMYFILDTTDDTYDIYFFLEGEDFKTSRTEAELAEGYKLDTSESANKTLTKAHVQTVDSKYSQRQFGIQFRDFSDATADATKTFRVRNFVTNNLEHVEKGSLPAEEVDFYGASMTLGGSMMMNYFVAADELPEGATASMKCDGVDLAAPVSVKLDGVDFYQFVAPVSASKLGVAQQLALYTTVDGETTLQAKRSYSAAEYLANIYTADGISGAMKTLIESMVYYGDVAAENTAASVAFTAQVTANGGTFTADAESHLATFSSALFTGGSLTLNNEVYEGFVIMLSDNLNLTVSSSDAAKVRVTVNDEEYEYDFVSGDAVIDCLHAAQLNTQVSLVLLDAEGNAIADSAMDYSIGGYLITMIEMDQSVDLAKVVSLYMTAARDYYLTTIEE